MKIVCDACSAKYSIADEKVAGKVFKIRCKKCSNIIVVRGNAAEEPAQDPYAQQDPYAGGYGAQDAADPSAVWHLVINQEQVGPLTDAEVRQRFASGEVDLETYTWQEGFDNWAPLGQVSAFADLAGGGAAAADPVANMFGSAGAEDNATVQSDPADLFASAGGGGGGDDAASDLFGSGPAAAAGGESEGGGLFGGGDAQAGVGGVQMSAEAEKRLRGERNENSVLFSLNNLAALASETPKAASGGGGGGGGGAKPVLTNTGGSEGSGLIDIRAMANVYHGNKGGGAAGGGTGSDSDLPVFGQTSFSSAAPIILPAAGASNSNKPLYIMLGVIGVLVVAAAILLVIVVKGSDDGDSDQPNVAAANTGGDQPAANPNADKKSATTPNKTDGTDKAPDTPKTDTPKTDTNTATGDPPTDTKPPSDTKKSDSSAGASRPSSSKKKRSSSSSKKKSTKEPTKVATKKKSSGGKCLDEVGCLLADSPPSCCSKFSKKKTKKKPSGGSTSGSTSGKEKLSRADISGGMSKIRGRVSACGSRHAGKGTVNLKVKVGSNGRVSSVSVKSSPNAALGNCAASAVKKAKFPASQKGISFTYPFKF